MGTERHIDWPRVLLQACRRLESESGTGSLARLAGAAGVSPAELQRQFRRRLGVSPKAYGQALRLHRLGRQVAGEPSALEAAFSAGFESASAAYAAAGSAFGVAPGRLRRALDIGWWLGLSDLGWMLMAATPRGICWLAFGPAPGPLIEELHAAFPRANFRSEAPRLSAWFEQVREFVLLPREALELPVDIQGTAFQARVWRALRRIPLGATVTYGELARRIGRPGAARAVARACATNRLALLVPCHRVVAADGSPSGYRWGAARKAELLRREAIEEGAGRRLRS